MNLSVVTGCSDPALAGFLSAVQNFLKIIQIIGPLLCIIALIILFINLISNPEDKKAPKKIVNTIIALLVMFFVPLLVNVSMNLVDENSNIKQCWENKIERPEGDASYIDDDSGSRKTPLVDSSLYEGGEKKEESSNINKYVFIGDSRTVQMYAFLNNDWNGANYSSGGVHNVGKDVYAAQGSMGLDWMKSTGIPAVQNQFQSGAAIIILMGVNDLYNQDNYISYINGSLSSWTSKGSKVYFVSVNPCDGNYSHLNSKIASFNEKVKSGLDSKVKWIDTNSYLNSSGFKTQDGLHYDKDTYKKIYDYIKSKV